MTTYVSNNIPHPSSFPNHCLLTWAIPQTASAHEVFGLVQAYTLRFVAQNSDAQSRLRDEFLGNAADQAFSPQPASTLGGLPYLSAVINESFRLRPTGTPLPRVTPKNKTTRLGGYEGIPGGVRVNTYQWFLHRDPRIWNAAEEWVPERWLKDGENAGPGKDQVLWQFCSGPRMCVGNHLTDYRKFPYKLYSTVLVGES